MRKRIWIVNYYTPIPKFISNPRHIMSARYLKSQGYDVVIVNASYSQRKKVDYIDDESLHFVEKEYEGLDYIHIKTRKYEGNGIQRMISIFGFSFNIFKYAKKIKKPDVILHNIHVPFDYLVYLCAKKLNVKYIAEVWDLWPNSFVRFGLVSEKNIFVKIAYLIEKRIYMKADKVIFSMEGGKDYIRGHKWDIENGGPIDLNKVYHVSNGLDLDEYNKNIEKYKLDDPDLIDDKYFKVIYIGSIKKVNNLERLIKAFEILKHEANIKLLIYGNGNERKSLEEYCINSGLNNVVFKEEWIPLKYVPYLLSKSSLNIINYQQGAGLFGVSSGKLYQYLASGKPICANVRANYCVIHKHNLGISDQIQTSQEYADAIKKIYKLQKSDYDKMCKRVKECSLKFDSKVTGMQLYKIIESL